ncbi:aspartic peptidase domain-containing protein, partial [Mycena amicta]
MSSYSSVRLFQAPRSPQQFQVALEMFTSYILVIAPTCTPGCPSSTPYNPTLSSSSSAQSPLLATISLYSTILTGYEFTDVVNLGLYTQKKTPIVISATSSSSWVPSLISGTIGLGGSTSDNALWLSLLDQQSGIQPEFSFWLSRSAPDGGTFTFGGVNTSLYSGEIQFVDTLDKTSGVYWTLEVSELTVQGSSISITPTTNVARIDIYAPFGIGAPALEVAAFWAQVPGASPIESNPAFYQYPCSTQLTVTVGFGGQSWWISIGELDLNFENPITINGVEFCIGGFYVYNGMLGTNWAFGVSLLKNVYSVFRPTTGQIGFAELSTSAGGRGTSPGVVPTAITNPGGIPTAITSPGGIPTAITSPGDIPTARPAPKSKSTMPITAIAGGAAGGGVALIIALIAIFCLCRPSRRRRNEGKED